MIFETAKAGYQNMWNAATILPEKRMVAFHVARKLVANRSRYQRVADMVGCPWWWIAITHNLEAGADFTRHLHNGDPLARRTIHVPAGRPLAGSPPFTWEDSAKDALLLKRLNTIGEWSIPRCLYEFERYNGFGYVARRVNSPYVWSFTNHQQPGKYVADGVFDRSAVSQQCGAAAVMLALKDMGHLEDEKPDVALEVDTRTIPDVRSPVRPSLPWVDAFFNWLWSLFK